MIRQEILAIINECLEEEIDTVPLTEDNMLYESNLDSFGYAVFWTTLTARLSDEGYDLNIVGKEYFDGIRGQDEVSGIIDNIVKCKK